MENSPPVNSRANEGNRRYQGIITRVVDIELWTDQSVSGIAFMATLLNENWQMPY